jgi:uncharacterized protein
MKVRWMMTFLMLACWQLSHASDVVEKATFQGLTVNASVAERDAFIAQYEGLPEPKALAMALSAEGQWAFGWTRQAAGILPAIGGALQACEQSRQNKQMAAPCDLVRVNGEELELGLALRNRLEVANVDAPTLLWRYRNKDVTVLVGGTLHGFKASLYPLPAAFEQAFTAADTLVLEVNVANVSPQRLFELRQKYMMLPDGQTLDEVLPKASLDQARMLVAAMGVPWEALNRMTPAALAVEMSQALMLTQGLMPGYGFEQHFTQRAMAANKAIAELETIEFQFELLGRMPIDLQTEDSEVALNEAKETIAKMVDAWYEADLGELLALINQESRKSPALNAFYKQLLGERNHGMAEKVAGYLNGGKGTYFVLVGAGHLAGEDSVIALLRGQGFAGVQLRRSGEPL